MKLFLAFMTFHQYLATDLYCWTPDQTFTVGLPHPNVYAKSGSTPDIAMADPNDCASIAPLSGIGNFINYDTVNLSFQAPSFATPAQTCTLLLKFHICTTSSCYWEDEEIKLTIINERPIIQDPKNNLIIVEDGKTQTESYIPYDIEMSPLTQMRLVGTGNPLWVSFSGNDLVCSPPNGTSGIHHVYVEAFDGAMVSAPFLIIVNVTDFPYFNDNLINQTVRVGGGINTVAYKLPSNANNSRGMPAIVTDVGFPYFVHLTSDFKWLYFDPPYNEGPGEYNITLQIASDGLYKISYFILKVINTPPYNIGNILNAIVTANS